MYYHILPHTFPLFHQYCPITTVLSTTRVHTINKIPLTTPISDVSIVIIRLNTPEIFRDSSYARCRAYSLTNEWHGVEVCHCTLTGVWTCGFYSHVQNNLNNTVLYAVVPWFKSAIFPFCRSLWGTISMNIVGYILLQDLMFSRWWLWRVLSSGI
jgi:hypothetical protein